MRRFLPPLIVAAVLLAPAAASASPFEPIGDAFRITHTGADGDPAPFAGSGKDVGYDERDDRYLVVFEAADAGGDPSSLFAQVLDGAGNPIGGRKLIADKGPDGTTPFDVRGPAVAWNPHANEFLVAWEGVPIAGDGRDVFARRVSPDGDVLGDQPTRVSDVGPATANPALQAIEPSIAFDSAHDEYLIVWTADDASNQHFEVYGQRLTAADAGEAGADDFRISRTGASDTVATNNVAARTAYDSRDDGFLVVWRGPSSVGHHVLRGQRLTAAGGEAGADDFQVSRVGEADDSVTFDVDLAYNGDDDAFLAVYDRAPDGGEPEIRAQRLDGDGAPAGAEVRVSDMGTDGARIFDAEDPDVVYNRVQHEYLVTWDGEELNGDFEVYAQRLARDGTETGINDLRLSFTGADGDSEAFAGTAHAAFDSCRGEYLAVWDSDPATGGLVNDEFEVFGRRLGDGSPPRPVDDCGKPKQGDPPPPPPSAGGAGPPQPPVGPPAVASDTTAPVLRLVRSRVQRILRQNGVKVTATADEDSLFTARGTIALPRGAARSVRLTGARTRARARRATLKLALPRKQRAAVSRALRRRRSLKAVVTVVARNGAGLTRTRRVSVKLTR